MRHIPASDLRAMDPQDQLTNLRASQVHHVLAQSAAGVVPVYPSGSPPTR